MRINSKSAVGGYPVLTVRKLLRRLNNLLCWNAETVQVILRTERTEAEAIVRALVKTGLAVPEPTRGADYWTTTQLAQSFASATAAKPITRQTADHALSEFLKRVDQVNRDACFLAKVTKIVLFGSYLKADVDRLSDLDIAVELEPKEPDWDRLRETTQKRVEQLRTAGQRFSSWLQAEYWWHLETFRFLKGGSRAISLIDYKAGKEFVDRVPHTVLFSETSGIDAPRKRRARQRRQSTDCPF